MNRSQLFALYACTAGEEISVWHQANNSGYAVYAYIELWDQLS
jgi:hypothetical protein